MITNKGRELIARYFSGVGGSWAGAIELGVGEDVVSVTDETLVFPVSRVPIEIIDYNASDYSVIARAVLPDEVIGTFYEIGVFSDEDFPEQQVGNELLVDYTGNDTVYDTNNAAPNATNARIATAGTLLSIASGQNGYVKAFRSALDMSAYSGNDVVSLAYHYTDTGGLPTLEVRFETTDTDYFSHSFTPATDYNIESFQRSVFTQSGSPAWSSISAINVLVDDQSDILLDGMVIEDTINIDSYGMIAREVLDTPIIKSEFIEAELTFKLNIGF